MAYNEQFDKLIYDILLFLYKVMELLFIPHNLSASTQLGECLIYDPVTLIKIHRSFDPFPYHFNPQHICRKKVLTFVDIIKIVPFS